MISGLLRHKVTIQRKATAADSIGHPVETWTTLAEVWASFKEEKGSEILAAGRTVEVKRGIFLIRYRDDVTVQNRLIFRGSTWEIENIRILENCRRTGALELLVKADG